MSMSHKLHIHKIGPINDCRLTLDTFTVLTGPQANGKTRQQGSLLVKQ